jgi:ribosome-interacting GTPase 1
MLPHEDVQFQLVDLPPVSADYVEPWMGGTLQNADAVLLVMDLSDPDCVDHLEAVERRLDEKKVDLVARIPGRTDSILEVPHDGDSAGATDEAFEDPFRVRLPALLVASKADLYTDPEAELETFRELAPDPFVSLAVSTETGRGVDELGPALFELLEVVRVYSKMPSHPPDMSKPFTLRRGGTVREVALQVHRGLASELRFARVWGPSAEFDGQQVSGGHVVKDKDVIELHW